MRAYKIVRGPDKVSAYVISEDGSERPLKHIVRHSPTGFEIGYGGPGPADLALSILVDFYKDTAAPMEAAQWNYQAFKRAFLADPNVRNYLIIPDIEIAKFVLLGGPK